MKIILGIFVSLLSMTAQAFDGATMQDLKEMQAKQPNSGSKKPERSQATCRG